MEDYYPIVKSLRSIKYLMTEKSDKCVTCDHTGELHEFDEVGTYCLICETYEYSLPIEVVY
jgi:hypothetical protein